LPLKVIEINRHRNRLILSERQAIQERRDVMKEKLIEELKEGEVRKGRVSSICDFGAFVDIGGADGLVHLSELSWSRVRHPSELLKIGEEVDVYVLGINAQEKKIALSIKRTQAEPWSRVASSYEVGKLVRGTVTQLANFGAFARIEDGIEGLIHVSELADERIQHPKQVVSEGQELLLRIIRIDPQRRRMGLSLRRALDTPDDELTSVFGEGILEERDALVQKIKDALEAEGLTGQFAEPRPDDGDTSSSRPAGTESAREPAQPTVVDQVAAFEERRQRAEEAAAGGRQARSSVPRQQRASESQTFEGEGMSAMEMAFALAGTPEEMLVDEAPAPVRPKRTRKPKAVEDAGEQTPESEAVEVETEAAVTEPEAPDAAAPVEAEAPASEPETVESDADVTSQADSEADAPAAEAEADEAVDPEVEATDGVPVEEPDSTKE
nr:S1 RNA-binding domain-containing protein [Chloroflexia bacterium]